MAPWNEGRPFFDVRTGRTPRTKGTAICRALAEHEHEPSKREAYPEVTEAARADLAVLRASGTAWLMYGDDRIRSVTPCYVSTWRRHFGSCQG